MTNEIEIFGKMVEIITDKRGTDACGDCALQKICNVIGIINHMPCEDASGNCDRYFKEIN